MSDSASTTSTSNSNQDSTAPEGEFASGTSQAAQEETSDVQASPDQEVLGASGSGDPSLEKDPSEWVTGGDPITAAQKSYLDTLARQAGEEIPADITKGEASEQIERLRKETGKD